MHQQEAQDSFQQRTNLQHQATNISTKKQIRKLGTKQQIHRQLYNNNKEYIDFKGHKDIQLTENKDNSNYLKNATAQTHKKDNCIIINIDKKNRITKKQKAHLKRPIMPQLVEHISENWKILEYKNGQKIGNLLSKGEQKVEIQTCFFRKNKQREQRNMSGSQSKANKNIYLQKQKIKNGIVDMTRSKIERLFSQEVNPTFIRIDKVQGQAIQKQQKCSEVDEFKIQKSKNTTNYNTNQSKNSSSIVNDHRGSNFVANKQIKWNIQDKITKLIKNQQQQISCHRNSINNTYISNKICLNSLSSQGSHKKQLDRSNYSKLFRKVKKQPMQILPSNLFQLESIRLPRSQIYKIRMRKFQKLYFKKYSQELCRRKLNNKFTQSKYFVPKVPTMKIMNESQGILAKYKLGYSLNTEAKD